MGKKTIQSIVLTGMLVLCTGCGKAPLSEDELNQLPEYSISGSYSYDTSDIKQRVEHSELVFVAKVVSYDGSRLEDQAVREDEKKGSVLLGTPYTDYTVQVIENIKGNLELEKTIKIIKDGGLSPDGDSIYIWDNDELPRTGNVYIFCATQEPDGTPLICGPYSNILITKVDKNNSMLVKYRDIAHSSK